MRNSDAHLAQHRDFEKLLDETADVIYDVTNRFRATDELTSSVRDLEEKQRVVEVSQQKHLMEFVT